MATIVMYIVNALIFNYWVLGFVNIASCYYAIWTYATYFAKRHPKVIEDDKAVEIVLNLEQKDTYLSEKGEIEDLNELMYTIAKPVVTGGKRQSIITAKTRLSLNPEPHA
ncbi:MAG: hypothetical protein Q9213_003771 [Squamulea squamosa]